MLLAIDTATAHTGLSLYDEDGVQAECTWRSQRNHTSQIVPQLDRLLQHLGKLPSDVRAVGVSLGPGSWSGLRAGLSIAKGLALAHNLPMIGIGTLEALAYQYRQVAMPVVPLIRLGRDRIATLLPFAEHPAQVRNLTLAELVGVIGAVGDLFFCGDVDTPIRTMLIEHMGSRAYLAEPAAGLRRPAYLAELAWQRWQANLVDDLASLEPIYLGQPVRV